MFWACLLESVSELIAVDVLASVRGVWIVELVTYHQIAFARIGDHVKNLFARIDNHVFEDTQKVFLVPDLALVTTLHVWNLPVRAVDIFCLIWRIGEEVMSR